MNAKMLVDRLLDEKPDNDDSNSTLSGGSYDPEGDKKLGFKYEKGRAVIVYATTDRQWDYEESSGKKGDMVNFVKRYFIDHGAELVGQGSNAPHVNDQLYFDWESSQKACDSLPALKKSEFGGDFDLHRTNLLLFDDGDGRKRVWKYVRILRTGDRYKFASPKPQFHL